jgi:hypothetical protein
MPQKVQTNRSTVKQQRPPPGTREPGELYVNFADLQLGVINTSRNAQDLVAVRFFSAATNYATGDFVIEAGRGYRAKTTIVAGPFNAANWDMLPIAGESEPPIAAGTTSQYWRGDKSWQTLDKNAVGLSQVDNTSDANKPVSTAQQTALNLKANIASPTFTGDPRAPTPAYPDNDTSIATTAFVATNFATLISPVFGGDPQAPTPATSDNDTSIATTAYVKANMAGLAPLASPTFTGDPKAPTPGVGDNDTSIATTAFVTNAVATGVGTIPPFPEAPNDGLTYGRKNLAWASVVGGAVVSDGAPPGPLQNGQLWWESDSGNTYIWVDDGNSQQWVQQNVLPSGPTGTGTAAISDGPPTNPVNGTLWYESDTGTLFVYYDDGNTRQWVQAGGITGPAPPMDGNEYVMVNGVWRLKSQAFDIAGLSSLIIPVPAWGPLNMRMKAIVFGSVAQNQQLTISIDGTTFLSGASDYMISGFTHNSVGGTFSNTAWSTYPVILMSPGTDVVYIPQQSDVSLRLTRAHANENPAWSTRGSAYTGANGAQTSFWDGYVSAAVISVGSAIKAVRWAVTAGIANSGRITVEWLP